MATLERMQLVIPDQLITSLCFNVSGPVGTGQKNDIGDVMIVQAFQQNIINPAFSKDGIVHPASFGGRKLRWDRAQMTITN